MANLTGGAFALNTDQLNLAKVATGTVTAADAGHIGFAYADGSTDDLYGAFTYSPTGALAGGVLNRAAEALNGAKVFDITGVSLAVPTFIGFVNAGDNAGVLNAVLAGADTLTGSSAADLLRGYAGNDTFVASGGADTVDGGAGTNTLRLNAAFASYAVTSTGAAAWTVVDQRASSPDGSITASSIQALAFADGTLTRTVLPNAASIAAVDLAFANVGRLGVTSALANAATTAGAANPNYAVHASLLDLASQVTSGAMSQAAATRQIEHGFDSTTSVATLSYAFFTGKTPNSAGYDYLVNSATNTTDLNDPYFAQFSEENRYINFAVALGKGGDGAAAFQAKYGSLSLTDTLKTSYLDIFGFAADDAKAAAILNAPITGLPGISTRADYFAYYGGDGPTGQGTKAALVGYLIVEAVKADLGTYAQANDVFLDALAAGSGQYNIDLKAVYGAHAAPMVGVSADGAAGV